MTDSDLTSEEAAPTKRKTGRKPKAAADQSQAGETPAPAPAKRKPKAKADEREATSAPVAAESPAAFILPSASEQAPPVKAPAPTRGEAVEFDPGAIFARFAPKEDEPKPAAETVETPAPSENQESTPASQNRPPRPDQPNRNHPQHHRQQGGQQQQHRPQQNGQQNGQQNRNDRNNGGARHPNDGRGGKPHPNQKFAPRHRWSGLAEADTAEEQSLELGEAFDYTSLNDPAVLAEQLALLESATGEALDFNTLYALPVNEIVAAARETGLRLHRTPQRRELVGLILAEAGRLGRPIRITGTLELLEDGDGLLVYGFDNYRVRELSAFVPRALVKKHALLRGHEVAALALPARPGETAPMVVKVESVMGADPEEVMRRTPFTELTPYYPTRRMLMETDNSVGWDNLSMRCVDLLCPIGLGQRGLIVAPPRTGKTVLLQAMANSISRNNPDVHLIVLLVDERPEEVTDFRRNSQAQEIVSSTFDENAESHVHAAEMVIERARRMVEAGRHVVILLDSITRLARAYNTMVPSTGKILSGGVEAGALTRPKRFFGSARNIEGGGSLTILGTALVETGSKMDEVIFEEFKGTGNMELDLDRDLANKRIFPAVNFERSGTRKEELIYHPDEMAKVYALRRAMKGVPSVEAMEMLIQRVKKTKTNAEFLVTLSR